MSENKVGVIIESLKADILDEKYAPGSAFPSVKMICRRFGVSHLTAVNAIASAVASLPTPPATGRRLRSCWHCCRERYHA